MVEICARCVRACVWMFDCESVRIEKEATNGPNFFNFIWNLNWKKEQLQTTTNFHFWRQNARACKNCELFCNFRKKTEFYKFIKFWVMSASMRVQCNMICVYNNLCNRNYFLFKEIFLCSNRTFHGCDMPIWNIILCMCVCVCFLFLFFLWSNWKFECKIKLHFHGAIYFLNLFKLDVKKTTKNELLELINLWLINKWNL